MVRVWIVVMVALAATACRKERHDRPNGCLLLPPAVRHSLTASPDGQTLYWLELTRNFTFDAELKSTWRLMRYDLRTDRTHVVLDDVLAPLIFIGGELLVRRAGKQPRLALLGTDGHTQEITPAWLDVIDVEPIDTHTIAFLADGDGARAVYTLDLGELRPRHLIDADVLLSTSGGTVFTRDEDDVVAIDLKTRATRKLPWIKKSVPLGDRLIYVDKGTVIEQSMTTGTPRPIVTTTRDWKLVYQGESVLVRSPEKDQRSYAYLISGSEAKPLATVVGEASVLGTVDAGKQTWALIGHNTVNFVGDLAETDAEGDICMLSATTEVKLPSRVLPLRFGKAGQALFDALTAESPGATMQIFENEGEPVTLHMRLKGEPGGDDLEKMRKRTLDLHNLVTRQLRDKEIRTEVTFSDRRRGVVRWKRDRLRERVLVGMGDALISDRRNFDFEVSHLDNVRDDDQISCTGRLRNLTPRPIASLDIKCSGNRSHVVHIDNLAADEDRVFSQMFDVSPDNEGAYLEVLVDGQPSEPRSMETEDLALVVFNLAAGVFEATGLWLESHTVKDDEIVVNLGADDAFLQRDVAAQEAATRAAYDSYLALRKINGLAETTPVRVHVTIELSEVTLDYDGTLLERGD